MDDTFFRTDPVEFLVFGFLKKMQDKVGGVGTNIGHNLAI